MDLTYTGAPDECSLHWPKKTADCDECAAETFLRSLKARLSYLRKHTQRLEKLGIKHGWAGEMAALEWAIPRLSEVKPL